MTLSFKSLHQTDLTVDEPSREEVGQVGQLHTANPQNKKSALRSKSLNRRPPVLINKKPENRQNFQRVKHHAFSGRNIRHEESRLGNRRKSKRIIMLSDSIPKGSRIREFNRYITNTTDRLKSFPGATSKELIHYVVPSLQEESFNSALKSDSHLPKKICFICFLSDTFSKLVDRHAPLKMKTQRGNHAPFTSKEMRKYICARNRLRNTFYKNLSEENERKFKRQRNLCLSLRHKAIKQYFSNITEK